MHKILLLLLCEHTLIYIYTYIYIYINIPYF